ncbi:MAG: hypothetical protein ACOH1J_04810 [Microbacteriaceae bacterium]
MTSLATPTPTPTPTSLATRLGRVIRLHVVSPMTFIVIPFIVLGIAWVISAAIFALLGATLEESDAEGLRAGARNSWAVLSPVWYLVSAGALGFAGTFPFALGMGSTRRDFHLGTSILFVVVSAGFSGIITGLAAIERATSGWGINNWMFNSLWIGTESVWVDFFGLFVIHLAVLFLGAAGATLWMRWRSLGVIGFITLCALLVVGSIAAIGLSPGSWVGFFTWVSGIGLGGMFGFLLLPVGALFLVTLIMIRFATPKN